MVQFQIIEPSMPLSPYVQQYWFLAVDNVGYSSQRYIPSGYTMLAFHRGNKIYSTLHKEIQPRSSLCGTSTLYTDIVYSGNLNLIAVLFQPVAARIFFGIPMNELRDRNIDIELVGDTALIDLGQKLMETEDNNQCVYLIEHYLLSKLCSLASDRYERMNMVIQSINKGQQNIMDLSQIACLGYKQFKRVFTEYTGLNPKEFLQIVRFRQTLYNLHADSQARLSQLACDWGYCDKSHLIKDFKAYTGYTPKEFLSICDPYSEYLSLFNSVFINGECETKYNWL